MRGEGTSRADQRRGRERLGNPARADKADRTDRTDRIDSADKAERA